MGTMHKGISYVEDFEVGDTVQTSKHFNSLNNRNHYEIIDIAAGAYTYSDPYSGNMIYKMKILLKGEYGSNWFNASSFKLIKKGNNKMVYPALSVSRPCIVYLLAETVDTDGNVTSQRTGDPKFFDTYSAATAYAQKAIQDKIRADNVYQKYEIYERKSVAQAKEPPVVFESE